VDLPQTLHAQLYLVAYDPQRHRFRFERDNRRDNGWLFGFALRAAMLTDLYLTGHVEDKQGYAHPTSAARPDDPVLHEALKGVAGRDWAQLIAHNEHHARRVVRDQLETTGWLRVQQHRMLGIIPTARLGIYDEDMVSGLADQVIEALRNAIDDRPANPRPLAVGLLAVQAQMPVISSFDDSRHRQELREMTFAAIEPILGLHQAIQNRLTDMRSDTGCSGGG
jgi:hypothetical protein